MSRFSLHFPVLSLLKFFAHLCIVAPLETYKFPSHLFSGPVAMQSSSPAFTPLFFTVLVSPESSSLVGFNSLRCCYGRTVLPHLIEVQGKVCSLQASMWVDIAMLFLCFAFIGKLLKTITTIQNSNLKMLNLTL